MALFNLFGSKDTLDSVKKRIEDIEKSMTKFCGVFDKLITDLPTVSSKVAEIDKCLSILNEKIRLIDTYKKQTTTPQDKNTPNSARKDNK